MKRQLSLNNRGEILTTIALGSLVVAGVVSLVANIFLQKPQTIKSSAQELRCPGGQCNQCGKADNGCWWEQGCFDTSASGIANQPQCSNVCRCSDAESCVDYVDVGGKKAYARVSGLSSTAKWCGDDCRISHPERDGECRPAATPTVPAATATTIPPTSAPSANCINNKCDNGKEYSLDQTINRLKEGYDCKGKVIDDIDDYCAPSPTSPVAPTATPRPAEPPPTQAPTTRPGTTATPTTRPTSSASPTPHITSPGERCESIPCYPDQPNSALYWSYLSDGITRDAYLRNTRYLSKDCNPYSAVTGNSQYLDNKTKEYCGLITPTPAGTGTPSSSPTPLSPTSRLLSPVPTPVQVKEVDLNFTLKGNNCGYNTIKASFELANTNDLIIDSDNDFTVKNYDVVNDQFSLKKNDLKIKLKEGANISTPIYFDIIASGIVYDTDQTYSTAVTVTSSHHNFNILKEKDNEPLLGQVIIQCPEPTTTPSLVPSPTPTSAAQLLCNNKTCWPQDPNTKYWSYFSNNDYRDNIVGDVFFLNKDCNSTFVVRGTSEERNQAVRNHCGPAPTPTTPPPTASTTYCPSGACVIFIKKNNYEINNLTINKNTIVDWVNNDTDAHTVVINSQDNLSSEIISPQILPGKEYLYKFTSPGTYVYNDKALGSAMMGIIIVK